MKHEVARGAGRSARPFAISGQSRFLPLNEMPKPADNPAMPATMTPRAILIAVPHRGSQIADNWIGNLGQSLYRADTDVQEAFRTLVENHRDQINPLSLNW